MHLYLAEIRSFLVVNPKISPICRWLVRTGPTDRIFFRLRVFVGVRMHTIETEPRGDALKRSSTIADALGQIVWLMSQSSGHRERKISSLEPEIFEAIIERRVRIYRKDDTPVACVIWCEEAGKIRVLDVVAPFGQADAISAHFLESRGETSWVSPQTEFEGKGSMQ